MTEQIGRLSADARAWLQAIPDDHPVNCDMEFADNPDTTYTATADGLRKLAAALNASVAWQLDPASIEAQVRHEQAHAAVARAAGFTGIRYGLYARRTPGGLCWQMAAQIAAPAGPVSKLARAAVFAAPEDLSPDDLAAVRDMGYRDADDVRCRLKRAGLGNLICEGVSL